MLARSRHNLGEIQVIAAALAELPDSDLLDDAERARAQTFALEAPRRRFVASRVFLRTVLGRALDRDPRDPSLHLSTLVHDAHATIVVAARGPFATRFVS